MSKTSKNKLTQKEWVIMIGVVALFFLFNYTRRSILNYPDGIWFYPTLPIALIAFFLKFKQLRVESAAFKTIIEKGMFIGLYFIRALVISLLVIGILLVPFNYYNIYYSKRNEYKVYNCKITGVTSGATHRVYFEFKKGTNQIYRSGDPILDTIYKTKQYDQYKAVVTVKDALFGTSVLYSLEVEHK